MSEMIMSNLPPQCPKSNEDITVLFVLFLKIRGAMDGLEMIFRIVVSGLNMELYRLFYGL